jgi:hypothetical protein
MRFTGVGVERDQAIGKQIVAGAIGAVKIGGGGTRGHVDDATHGVERHPAPVVCRAAILPRFGRPGLVAEFAGVGNRVERPAHLAGPDVVGANVAGRGGQRLRLTPSQNQEVFVDDAGTGQRDHQSLGVAAQALAQVDAAMLAKRGNGFPRRRIQGVNKIHDVGKDAPMRSVGPRRKAAIRLASDDAGIEFPKQLSGAGVERDHLLRRRVRVENSIHNQWAGLKPSRFSRIETPRDLKLLDVGAIDLREAGVPHVFRRPAVHGPITRPGQRWFRRVLRLGKERVGKVGQGESGEPDQNRNGEQRLHNPQWLCQSLMPPSSVCLPGPWHGLPVRVGHGQDSSR